MDREPAKIPGDTSQAVWHCWRPNWRRMAGHDRPRGQESPARNAGALCALRLETAVAEGELPTSTDIDGLSRFYLSVFQGMAVQAKDGGATSAELRAVAAAAIAAWPGGG